MSPVKIADAAAPRVRFVVGSLEIGGTERHVASLAAALPGLGYRVSLFNISGQGSLAALGGPADLPMVCGPVRLPKEAGRHGLKTLAMGLAGLRLGWETVRAPADIVHFFLPHAYVIGAPLALLLGPRLRLMSRRSLNAYGHQRRRLFAIERRLHPHMSRVLANSEAIVEELVAEGVPRERLQMIPNGVDLARFDVEARTPPLHLGLSPRGEGPLTLAIVANLIPYKGHADLLSALGSVVGRLPPWRLLIVGRDDGIGARLAEQIVALRLADRVHLLGARPDVPGILARADICISASHEEGSSNAVLEGMAAGLPMVVTSVGGSPEQVVEGETGMIVPPRDPRALGAAILRLASEPELRRRMGEAGRRRVAERFSLEAMLLAYDRLYRRLLEEGRR